MVQARLNATPEVQRRIAADPGEAPIVGDPQAHPRDLFERNWDLADLQNGAGLSAAFRSIVDELRLLYDLEQA